MTKGRNISFVIFQLKECIKDKMCFIGVYGNIKYIRQELFDNQTSR